MKILLIDDQLFMLGYIRELITTTIEKAGTEDVELQDALTLDSARKVLAEGFVPDLVMCDFDLSPTEIGPEIFELLREKNPKVFICLMSGRNRVPQGLHDIFIIKTNLQSQIPNILLQAAMGM